MRIGRRNKPLTRDRMKRKSPTMTYRDIVTGEVFEAEEHIVEETINNLQAHISAHPRKNEEEIRAAVEKGKAKYAPEEKECFDERSARLDEDRESLEEDLAWIKAQQELHEAVKTQIKEDKEFLPKLYAKSIAEREKLRLTPEQQRDFDERLHRYEAGEKLNLQIRLQKSPAEIRAAGMETLAGIAKGMAKRREAEAAFRDTFTDSADGELFVKALQAMVRGCFFVESAEGWDCACTQADLKRFCECYEFNKWTLLARYITISKKKINTSSLKSQQPPDLNARRKSSFPLSADVKSRWPAIEKALQDCQLLS